jgi:hypothetical protein
MAVVAAFVVLAGAGYWWMNRPAERYKPDNSGLYPINVNGKYGFMDRSGKTVIAPQFDGTYGFSEGLAHVRVGDKWGYINTKGSVVITPQFVTAGPFRFGRAVVMLGNRFGFIDKDGKYICSPDFVLVGAFSSDLAPVWTADRVYAFVNRSGKIVLSGKVQVLGLTGFTEGLAPAGSGGKWGYIDTAGNWVINPQFEAAWSFVDGLAPVSVGGRWGYIDQKGKFIVNPQYDYGGEFYEGNAAFGNGGKYGFIDTKGRVVVDAKFPRVGNFSDGLAPVQTEEGWGFIDRTGKMVVRPQFDSADVFQNGLARVTVGGKEAYITTPGAFVVDPFPGTNVRAERARLAAEVAQAANATAAKRSRVEQGILGEWVGDFGRLTITSNAGAIGAVLLNNVHRDVLHGDLLDDNKLLRLTGTSATYFNSSSGANNLLTFYLELSADGDSLTGQYRDSFGHTGAAAMKKGRP